MGKKKLQSGFSWLSLLVCTLSYKISKFELTSQIGSILIGLTNGNQFKFSHKSRFVAFATNRDFAAK